MPQSIVAELYAPPVPEPGPHIPKLIHLQVLRAFAASLVVVDHTIFPLVQMGIPAERFKPGADLIGWLGVAAFFTLSGLIMMRQSAGMFGTPRGPVTFIYRRIVRIVPLYWILTFVTVMLHLLSRSPFPPKDIVLSFLFIPNFRHHIANLPPVAIQGWTLNYEMAFYLLFTFALFFPRKYAILLLLLVPELLVAIGRSFHFPQTTAISSLLGFYTAPVIVLFGRGVLIGAWESQSRNLVQLKLPFSPAYLLFIPPAIFMMFPGTAGQSWSWELLSFYSILVVLCCTLVANGTPGRILSLFVLLGDASYSTYLFHMAVFPLVLRVVVGILNHRLPTILVILASVLASVIAANALGLLIHSRIERPLIRAIKSIPLKSIGAS